MKPSHKHLTWKKLQNKLEKYLQDLPEGEYITIETTNDTRVPGSFVQFFRKKDALVCEASSNVYLSFLDRMSEKDNEKMRHLGWDEPDYSGNWNLLLTQNDPYIEASALAIRTLRDVYGVLEPDTLQANPSLPMRSNFPLKRVPQNRKPPEHIHDGLDITKVGDVNYGLSPDGVYSVGLHGYFFRIQIAPAGLVFFKQIAIMVVANPGENIVKASDKIAEFAQKAKNLQIRYAEEKHETGLWLVKVEAVEERNLSISEIRQELLQMIADSKWIDAYIYQLTGVDLTPNSEG